MFRHARRNAIELGHPIESFQHRPFTASAGGDESDTALRLESQIKHQYVTGPEFKVGLVQAQSRAVTFSQQLDLQAAFWAPISCLIRVTYGTFRSRGA